MKARIIGSILVILVVGGLFLLTNESSETSTTAPVVNSGTNDAAFKSLKLD